jgi:predicted transcriptional regulator
MKEDKEERHESRHIKKESLLKSLEQSLGVVTVACKKADIPRSTYYKWLNNDEVFAKQVRDIENVALDFAESQLHTQIGNGNTSATIFYLKTKGKKRGYIERQEITGADGMPTNFQIEIIDKTEDTDK